MHERPGPESEPPSGLPDDEKEITPLGVPADADGDADNPDLPGFPPDGEGDSAG